MTREEAVDWIRRLVATMKEETSGEFPEPEYKDDVYEALDRAIEALEQELRWIPVSERLPEESGKYIVTFNSRGEVYRVGEDFYTTEEDARRDFEEYYEEYIGWNSQNVVAWMSLPEPYKTESEND